jgi:AbrB family looped-hinge helix DNA binding protein
MAEDLKMANNDVFGFEDAFSPAYSEFAKRKSESAIERVKISEGGRLVIPAAMRDALGVKPGDTLLLKLDNGSLLVDTITSAVRRVHAIAKKYDTGINNAVDQFLVDKREEQRRADERMEKLHKEGSRNGLKRV